MLRRSICMFQFAGGAKNPFEDLLKPVANPNRFDGNFGGNPGILDESLLQNMRSQMQRNLTPELQSSIQNMMASMRSGQMPMPFGGGGEGGKIGVMAFGMGENERGKKVARGAKLEFDPATGKMSTDFQEHQIDPDDPMLPKETVENYDTANCIEVEFDDKNTASSATNSSGSSGATISEMEIEVESPTEGRK